MVEINIATEDGGKIYYGVPFYTVCFENHTINIGTSQERELFKPYKTFIYQGAGMNKFGLKLFSNLESAQKYCIENRKHGN